MQQTDQSDLQTPVTPQSLGQQLRESVPIKRIQSLSIHDRDGDTLWLSEGQLGPDEHNVALEAITVFDVEGNRAYVSEDLGDGRSAAFLAACTPQGELVGMAMIVADTRSIDALGAAKLMTPKVRSIMQRLAIVLKPASTGSTSRRLKVLGTAGTFRKTPLNVASIQTKPGATAPAATAVPLQPVRSVATPPAAAAQRLPDFVSAADSAGLTVYPPKTPAASARDTVIRPAVVGKPAGAGTQPSEPAAAVGDISLHVQQLMKLRSGGRTRRYEVLVRGRQAAVGDGMSEQLVKALSLRESAAAIDRLVVSQLTAWLKQHPQVWNSDPASFSINLSNGSLLDPSFIPFVSEALRSSGIAPDTIGFEVPEQAYLKHREGCAAFMDACEKIGCYVVIDDFSMHSDVVPFLASRALRVVKIDPRLTQSAMRDRLAQALVIAISQSSKVLGLHCVAKRIDTAATRQWLSAVGIDFAQGFVLEDPQPIDALAAAQAGRPSGRPTPPR